MTFLEEVQMGGRRSFWSRRVRASSWSPDLSQSDAQLSDDHDIESQAMPLSSATSFEEKPDAPDAYQSTSVGLLDAPNRVVDIAPPDQVQNGVARPMRPREHRTNRASARPRSEPGLIRFIIQIPGHLISGARQLIARQARAASLHDPIFQQFVIIVAAGLYFWGSFRGGTAILLYALVLRGFRLLGAPKDYALPVRDTRHQAGRYNKKNAKHK
jgi:hypothetical protein